MTRALPASPIGRSMRRHLTRLMTLLPGSYRLMLIASDASGNVSLPERVRFRVRATTHRV